MKISAVDLFSGAGGLTHGLESAGIDVSHGVDLDSKCRYPYNQNNEADFRKCDVKPLADNPARFEQLFHWDSDMRLLAACAPCQPFSNMNNGGAASDHAKWRLLDHVRRLVEATEPDFVVTENVLGVRNDDVYESFIETLEANGYDINDDENKKVYCPEYGIPQKRKRWVVIASKHGKIELPEPFYTGESEYPTVAETIDHLPEIKAGEPPSYHDLHRARTLSEKNLERIRHMEPGGDWRLWEEEGLEHLLADCHKKDSGRSYKAPYSRMRPDEPAPTITTQFYNYGSGRFGHYNTDQDRALSLLEGALLQTFPSDYDFYEDWEEVGVKNLGRMIGNAVPPKLGAIVGRAICEHVGAEVPQQEFTQTPTPATSDD